MIQFIKIKERGLKIWKDPVWSKVIAAGILSLIAIIAAKFTNHSWQEIYNYAIQLLTFNVPIYGLLSLIAIYFITKLIVKFFRKRNTSFWRENIGNYTFKELYNILLTEKLPIATRGMEMFGQLAPDDDLLTLFQLYYIHLNTGVEFDDNIGDGYYLYSILAPRFVGFGLVDSYQAPIRNLPGETKVAYKISELGRKFHASLEKIILADKIKQFKKNKERL
jgi:hypothetical protein